MWFSIGNVNNKSISHKKVEGNALVKMREIPEKERRLITIKNLVTLKFNL